MIVHKHKRVDSAPFNYGRQNAQHIAAASIHSYYKYAQNSGELQWGGFFDSRENFKSKFRLLSFAHSCLFVYQGIFRHFPIYKTGSRPIPESTAHSRSSNIQFLNFLLLFLLQNLRLFQHLFCLFLCFLRSLVLNRKFSDADKDSCDCKRNQTRKGTFAGTKSGYR